MSFVDVRRAKAARAWGLTNELVLITAGHPIGIPGGADQTFPYKPHPQYRWLTDCRRPGGVLAYDPSAGWTHFQTPMSELELVWGPDEAPTGKPLHDLDAWMEARTGRPVAVLGSGGLEFGTDPNLEERLGLLLDHARRPKDEYEISLLRKAANATAAGYLALGSAIRPGVTERELQIVFESAVARAGATSMGYASIVGSGPNTAVFHFSPGDRKLEEGDLVLVDAGGEVDGYVCDVTRTFAATGEFDADQQWLYDSVLRAETRCIEACVAGTEWLDVHRLAATSMAESMIEAGLLTCEPDEAVDAGVMALFFPHGIGHLVGLGVRDAAGLLPGRNRTGQVGGTRVRIDLPLEFGYNVTVEPGLYFIPALLEDEVRRLKFAPLVYWPAVDKWIGRGGVRIEDNILVTPSGPQNLTAAIPK